MTLPKNKIKIKIIYTLPTAIAWNKSLGLVMVRMILFFDKSLHATTFPQRFFATPHCSYFNVD